MYLLVLAVLFFLVALFTFLTRIYQ